MRTQHAFCPWPLVVSCAAVLAVAGCTTEESPLAPYGAGGRDLAKVTVQDSVFTPNVTWVGGYVSVFGVNRGSHAGLDTSLVWLIYQAGDNVHYPVTFGRLPAGAQDLTTQYGGTPLTRLVEDNEYTFWVLKGDAWAAVSANPGKPMVADTTASETVVVRNDTVFVSMQSLAARTKYTDVYTNVRDVNGFGRLVTDPVTFASHISVTASDTCNRPLLTWTVVQAGVTDQNVAAMGICLGGDYSVTGRVWEMISKEVLPDTIVYWKNNVISSPMVVGTKVEGTETFVELPLEGLRRGENYYIWIAAKDWDGKNRSRTARYYAYATFTTW